ncbi:MAG: Ig-like domain-containing protein [Luteolibacter sp.]
MIPVFQFPGGRIRLFLLTVLLTMPAALAQTPVTKILPLGDSITRGNNDVNYPNGDIPGGYRKEFGVRLNTAGIGFDFVGTQTDNVASGMDPDHSGFNGFRTDQIIVNLPGSLALAPDVVMMHLGTNDILQSIPPATAAGNLDILIGQIVSTAPNRKLYVSTIIPFAQGWAARTAAQLNAEASDYNTRVRNLVRQHADRGEKVFLVDMNASIVLTNPDPSKNFFLTGDGIHPGQAGYNQMAAIWFQAIAPTLSDTIVNGSFELGLTGWASSGQISVKSGPPYTTTDGTKLAAFHPQESATNGVMSQIFPTTAGTTYELAFDVAGADDASGQKLEAKLSGAAELASQTISVTGANGGGIAWRPQSLIFVADGASTWVTFTDRSTTGNSTGLLLDHVRLIKRPPPVTGTPNAWIALRAHPQNPHILEFRGRPTVLRTFAEHYSSVINSDFDFIPYLNTQQRDGMNLTRAFLVGFRHDGSVFPATPLAPAPARFMQPWLRSGTNGPALDGLGKWDFTTWNEEYFTRLRTFARACGVRGVVAELTLFCTPYTSSDWQVCPFNPSNNVQGNGPANRYDVLRGTDANLMAAQEAAVRRIASELNEFDNVYFEVINEPFWNEPGVKDDQEVAFQNRMLQVIRETEATLPNKHLVAHNFPQQADSMAPGFDVINEHYPLAIAVQGPNPAVAGAEALLRDHYQRNRILALDETDTTCALQTRLESWMFLLGGGGIYNGLDVPYFVYSAQDETGDTELGRSFRKGVRDIGSYMDNLNLVALRRDLSWVSGGIPTGATLQAMASPGQQYVAYFHHGQDESPGQLSYNPIDGANHVVTATVVLPAGSWRAVWTRPSDLTVLRTEEFTHTGSSRTLAAVTYQEDVALRIDRTGAGDLTPPPGPTGFVATSDAAGAIRLIWNPVQAADLGNYQVYRSASTGVPVDAAHRISVVAGNRTDFSDTTTTPGSTWRYVITAVDLNGNESIASSEIAITSTLDNLPYGGTAWTLPGRIEAENFDNGGEGVAWHDLTAGNEAGQYRPSENVDIAATTDEGGGYQVFETQTGEWLEYSVNAAKSGKYVLDLRVANPQAGGRVRLEADGVDVSGTIEIPQTDGWQTVTVPDILLASGAHVLRLTISATGPAGTAGTAGAVNWFSLSAGPAVGPIANAGTDLQIADQDNSGSEAVNLSAASSLPGDAPIQSYTWLKNGLTIASGLNPTVALAVGNHLIKLKVTDGNGLDSIDEILVTVRPGGFVNGSFESGYTGWTTTGNQGIQSGSPYTATDGTKLVGFNGANLTPNGVLSQTFGTIPGATYTLAFDAGVLSFNTNSQTMQVTATGNTNLLNRTITITGLGGGSNRWLAQSFTFVADRSTTTLAFRDLSTATLNIDLVLDNVRVSGPPPVLPNTAPFATADAYSTNEGQALAVPAGGVLANDSDADANPLTAVLNVGPSQGTLALNSGGGFTYTPAAGFFGSDTFTYHANDGSADSNVATVALTVSEIAPAPIAVADSYAIDQNTALEVPTTGVLANDSDARGRALTAVFDAGPAHGSLILNPNGTFAYTPAVDYFGTDSFTYHANNGVLNSATATVTLTVSEVVPPPVAAEDSYFTNEGTVLVVAASGVLANDSDPTSRPLTVLVNQDPAHGILVLATDGGFSYTPAVGFYGMDTFTYRARNGSSASAATTVTLAVHEVIPAPVAVADSFSTSENATLTVSATGVLANDSDARARPLTAVLDTQPAHGSVTLNANGGFIYTPASGFFGTDSFTYHAYNGVLDSGIVTATINVSEVIPAPVADADAFSTDQNTPLVVPAAGILANDSDPRSRILTAVLNQGPAHGILALNADGSFTYTPAENFFGPDSFTYHANNGSRDSNVVTVDITLTVNGGQPETIALADTYTIHEDGTLVVAPAEGVLANDTEANSMPLTAVVNSDPAHGNLTLDPDGGFTYTPSGGFFGSDSFSYHANNGTNESNITTVELLITEVVPPPVAVVDAYMTNENAVLVIPAAGLLSNDSDPRSRPLAAVLDLAPGNGTVTVDVDGGFIYTPAAGFFGTDSFTYQAHNGTLASESATVTLTVNEVVPPPLTSPDSHTTAEGVPLVVPAVGVLANDTDPRSHPLTALQDLGPAHGTLTLDADGGFQYAPAVGFFGTDSFTYRASNGSSVSEIETVTLSVTEVVPPPVAAADSYAIAENTALVIPAKGVLTNDTDPRSRPLTAVLNAGPSHGTLALNPNGSFTYTPSANYFGPDSFTYHARNGVLDSNTVTVALSLTEVVPAPVAVTDSYQTQESTPLVIPSTGVLTNDSDPRSRPLTAVLNAGPSHGTLALNPNGSFSYTPSGGYFGADSFTYHARNGVLDSNTVTVALTITEIVPAPVAVADSYQADANTPLAVPAPGVLANDNDPRSRPLTAVLDSGTANGTLVLNPDGSFTYTPATGYSGSDAFTYHTRNGFRDSSTATVSLTIRPPAPLGLVNGSFESGFTGWTTTGNLGIQSSTPYAATEGTKLVAFNSANLTPNAVLSQSFGTIAGQNYTLAFDLGVLAYNTSPQTMLVTVNGATNLLTRTLTVTGAGNGTNRWLPQSFTFVADGSTATLAFRDQSTSTVNLDMELDNARVTGIANTAPFAAADSYQAIRETALVVPAKGVLANDSDAESNTLTAILTVAPTHGTLTLNANGGFTYTPAAGYTGTDSFSYRANDGLLNSTIATVSLTIIPPPPNTAPVAAADSYSTSKGTALTVPASGVLTNDTDAESSPLTATLVSGPSSGTLTLNANGGFTYTPTAGFTGSDSFTYRANDGNLDSNTATVTISVSEIVPGTLINGSFEAGFTGWTTAGNQSIQSTAPYTSTDGTKLVGFNGGNSTPNAVLSQSFATAAGQTYSLAFDVGVLAFNSNAQTLQVSVTGSGSVLSRTITVNGAGNGSNRWVPQSFTFVANSSSTVLTFRDQSTSTDGLDLTLDNVRLSAVASLPNTAPVAVAESYSTVRDIALVIPAAGVLANDTDAQSDPLTAVINAGPGHGAVALAANGGFSYTPATGYTGADSFTYHANDGRLDSNIVTVTLSVTAPVATTLVNGSFESGFTGWVTTGNQGIQSASPYAASDGTKLVAFNGGNQSPNGALAQSFATNAGQSYTLAFDAGVLAFNSASQTLQVTVNGTASLLTRTITLLGTGSGTSRWQAQTFTFVADSSSATLAFRDQSATTSNLDLLLDNVRITSQPLAIAASVQINAFAPVDPAPQAIVSPPVLSSDTPSISGTPGNISVGMTASSAGTYSLECSPDLVTWEWVVEKQAAAGDQVEFRDTRESVEPAMFYRIGFLPASLSK